MYTFYEYPRCTTCQKAKAELHRLGIEFEAVDIKNNPPKAVFLRELLETSKVELKKFFNTSGNSYRALGLKERFDDLSVEEALELLASDGMLIKRPLLIQNNRLIQIGYRTPYELLDL